MIAVGAAQCRVRQGVVSAIVPVDISDVKPMRLRERKRRKHLDESRQPLISLVLNQIIWTYTNPETMERGPVRGRSGPVR
jgi:hypothetical protein